MSEERTVVIDGAVIYGRADDALTQTLRDYERIVMKPDGCDIATEAAIEFYLAMGALAASRERGST